MIIREEYLQQLISWKDEQVIKVVTGIRRCGKSTLLKQFQEYLRQNGTEPEQIVSVNFEDFTAALADLFFFSIRTPKAIPQPCQHGSHRQNQRRQHLRSQQRT